MDLTFHRAPMNTVFGPHIPDRPREASGACATGRARRTKCRLYLEGPVV